MEHSNTEMQYLGYFGLRSNPFPVVPDADNFFLSRNIDRVISEIVHGIDTRKGFMVLTGEIGLGKTTICRKILHILENKKVETSLIFHTAYQDVELLREINRDFGLEDGTLNLRTQMKILNDFLLSRNIEGRNCTIIIDDAQNLSPKSLELIRMISNLETDQQKLVQILLIGQPELIDKLNSPELRQLKSRIIIREETNPLDIEELKNYLLFKLNTAGNQGKTIVRKTAVSLIHRLSKGNFRQVNKLMDRSLYAAFLHDTTELNRSIVKEAYHDLFPEKPFFLKKPIVWCTSAVMTLCIAVGITFFAANLDTCLTGQIANANQPLVVQEKNRPVTKALDKQSRPLAAVSRFLHAHQLSQYQRPFIKALEENRFSKISDIIFRQTGLRLVALEKISDRTRDMYGILAYPSSINGKMTFYLFWRPRLIVGNFFYGYQSERIKDLQVILRNLRLYHAPVDGIVGRHLIRAVIHFQEQAHLPATGLPDDATLFLLCQEGGATKHHAG